MFLVWHHVADRARGARELHRVVRPGGTLFVRANVAERMPSVLWLQVVPEWRDVDMAQFRSADDVTTDFANAGWTFRRRDEVTWMRSASLEEDLAKLKLRALSLFEHISDEVADAGFAKIEAALPSLSNAPQYETSDLLVFRR